MKQKKKVFRNKVIDKKQLKKIMSWAFEDFGIMKASFLANKLKDLGFEYATRAGLSLSIEDLRVPPIKSNLMKSAAKTVSKADFEVDCGKITEVERFLKIINTWNTTSESLKEQVVKYFKETDPLNSIYIMAFSGARGNLSQVRQLVGMRGLMADPNGQIMDLPIITNFREGLTVTDYIISSYGARKGLVDTALKTADSGYLTRRLVDVAQDMITREKDCKTKAGISLSQVIDGSTLYLSLEERIIGRILAFPIINTKTGKIIGRFNEEITPKLAQRISSLNVLKVSVRSPLTCSSSRSVCQQCYGWNLAYGSLIDLGEAVGIIAAQSIGEPGTQLTMRTFHTGGVFTSEPSRQIRAQFSGKIQYSKALKTQVTRTKYGEVAFLSENEASLNLITYTNLCLKLEIFPETLIFVANNSYIRKNDIVFELSSKTKKSNEEKVFKKVLAKYSGEIIFQKNKLKEPDTGSVVNSSKRLSCLVWILSGQVYNIPINSRIQIDPFSKGRKDQTLAEAKLISFTEGKIDLFPIKQNKQISILRPILNLSKYLIYIEENLQGLQKCVFYPSKKYRIVLTSLNLSKNILKNSILVGNLMNPKYKTKTGGSFFYSGYGEMEKQDSLTLSKKKFKIGMTIFYIPECTYKINQTSTQVFVKTGDLVQANKEIFKDHYACLDGIVEVIENKKIIKYINIKPCRLIPIVKEKKFKKFHQKWVFPGETLMEDIVIKDLSLIEIKTIHGQTFLIIYPIVRYEILHELKPFFIRPEYKSAKIYFNPAQLKFQEKLKEHTPIQLIKQKVIRQLNTTSKNFQLKVAFQSKEMEKKQKRLHGIIIEHLFPEESIPKELKKKSLTNFTLIQNKQYIEPYTTLTSFQVLIPESHKITSMKEQNLEKERKVLIRTNSDFKSIFIEEANTLFELNKLVQFGEKTKSNFVSANSGLISNIHGNTLLFHKGQPYLFSQGGILEKQPGDLIKKKESLGQLVYEKERTGDIVQGLPRVDQILEARKPKKESFLAEAPGIITEISNKKSKVSISVISHLRYNTKASIWVHFKFDAKETRDLKNTHSYTLKSSLRLLVGKFEFITVGQALNDGPINPHLLLDTYYIYFRAINLFSPYESAYRSLSKIQALLLNSVQSIYYSQGVNISDKHLEIIVKQMTGKVEILNAGRSPFLLGELVDLHQVYYVNQSLNKKNSASFKPILLGITKASLKTNSFISAASFQYTTQVLTEAAIQGKIDWLRGLKENVIVGRLIPAGTGFNAYSDISHIGVKLPSSITKSEKTSSLLSKQKYTQLKNRVKFKIL